MIYSFVGLPGTGKTISCVHFLKKRIRAGVRVFTNTPIKIRLSKYQPVYLTNRDLLEALVYEKNSTFFIDEAQIVFDPYVWNRTNPFFLYKFSQGRKLSLDLFYTTQRFNHVLKRLRELTNYIIKCKPVLFGKLFNNTWYDPEIWDKQHLFGTPMEDQFVKDRNYIFPWDVKKLVQEYDTNFLIEPFNASDFSDIMRHLPKDEKGRFVKNQIMQYEAYIKEQDELATRTEMVEYD